MIEIKSPKIESTVLLNEIENIIDKTDFSNIKQRKSKKKRSKKKIYLIEDFTKYHDIEFIENLYRKVLLREVEREALESRLELLRSGKRTKTEILSMVRFSKEGRDKNVPILGIKKRLLFTILNRIPIISFFIKLLILPKFMERVNRFEAQNFIHLKEQNAKIAHIQNQLQDIEKSLNIRIENSLNQIKKSQNSMDNKIGELQFRINEIKRAKEQLRGIKYTLETLVQDIKDGKNFNIVESLEKESSSILDEFYISFEDRFRGEREDIKERQNYYLPIIEDIVENRESELIIDIGSGRGEWLELLKENHFRAKGVDLNRLMVKESKELDLDVIEGDAVEYLKSLNENSISVITGFHIVEHLPFKVLIELFDEVYRVLRGGGAVIFETPNPENLRVGAYSFYTDPTHLNPIPPETLKFIAENRGFKDVSIHRLHPLKEPKLTDNRDINDLLIDTTKAQDYSIVGYK